MRAFILVMACFMAVIGSPTVKSSLAADYTPPSLRAWQRAHEGHLIIEWAQTAKVQQKREGDRLVLRFANPLDVDIKPSLRNISNFVDPDRTTVADKDISLVLKSGVLSKVRVREKRIVTIEFSRDPSYEPQSRIEASTIEGGVRLALDWSGPTNVKANQDVSKFRLEISPPRALDPDELVKLQQTLRPWFHELRSETGPNQTTLSLRLEPQIEASIRSEGTARTIIDLVRNASTRLAPVLQTKSHVFIPARKPAPSTSYASAQKFGPPIPKRRPRPTEELAAISKVETQTIAASETVKILPRALVLDWKEPVAAAIFLRAGHLWAVFDEPDASLLSGLPTPPSPFGAGTFVPATGGTALRFPLLKPVRISVSQTAQGQWQVEPASSSSTPQPLTIERVNGSTTLRVTPVSGEHIVAVIDPAVGDRLDILPLDDLGIGQPERRRFVDLEMLPTTQGLVWRQLNDQLVANIDDDGLKFSSSDGLLLSTPVTDPFKASELTVLEALARGEPRGNRTEKDQVKRPAVKLTETGPDPRTVAAMPSSYFDLADSGVERELLNEHRRIRRQAIRKASPERRDDARLSLARLLVAERLANEARTILSTISDEADDHIVLQKRALTGVSALLSGHLTEATSLLLDPDLNDDDEIDIWRAALESKESNWLSAAERWRATSKILDKYPPRLKLDLGLMALRAAIETDDDTMVQRGIRRLTSLPLNPYEEARVDAMKALKAERAGDLEKARALLTGLIDSPNQTIRTLAKFQLTIDKLKEDNNNSTLLKDLDRRLPTWRGHPQEQAMLDKLARQYKDANALREALTTWQRMIRLFPKTADSQKLKKARQETFVQALTNATKPTLDPLEVYAIYLDFIDLVPDDPESRDVYRHLAEHLTGLDLLDEALDVLQSLMTSSDDDLERSELALEIARLMLQLDRPTPAVSVLAGSERWRKAMPATLNEERRMVKARALARLDRTDEALRILRDLQSDPARKLQAKILWDDRRWPRLAAIIESHFADADPTSPLTTDDQQMVLWLAMARQRENTNESLNAVRERFATVMQDGPYVQAFDVATQSTSRTSSIEDLLAATESQLTELQQFRQAAPASP